jgi:hypothetical protein
MAGTESGTALETGAHEVNGLLAALEPLTARYGLHGRPSAQGIGTGLGEARAAVVDRAVDTGAAIRLAVLDIEHIATLLAHLAMLAAARNDRELEEFCGRWQKRLRAQVKAVRKAAVGLGSDPDRAAEPLDPSAVGHLLHRAGWAFGTLGEWIDSQTARAPGPNRGR